ncbi:ABC transporter ATP-binding protein [Streptomyces sp. NPDC087300]|uniref:ABC transporter ATP-binding protein n=1 Tax=Streptomyces sp. NPDC087300 TaxID=3365780 RepID=UPI003802CC6E
MLIRLALHRLAPYRSAVALTVLLQVAQTSALLWLPALNAVIIDQGVVRGDTGVIMRVGGQMLAVTLVQVLCALGALHFGARTALAVGRDLREDVFAHVQRLSVRQVARFGTPSLVNRTTNDVHNVQTLLLTVLTLLVAAPLMCAGGVIMALGQDVPLSSVLLLLVPVLVVQAALILRRLRPLVRSLQELVDDVARTLREQITGVRVVRAFVRDAYEQRRFARSNDTLTDISTRVGRMTTLLLPLGATTVNLFGVAVVWLSAPRIENGSMRIGALTALITYLTLILTSVLTVAGLFMVLPRGEVSAERITHVLGTEPEIGPPVGVAPRPARPARVEWRGVELRYPGAEVPVLSGLTMTAEPGAVTAVIGPTGSGKTTLLGLVPRLFDVTAGTVRVGGQDVRHLDPAALTRTVGMVPQKAYLFSGTVASNLRFGRPDASDDELWRALDVAQARDFVARMPDQLRAPISQGGSNVSGGQRQRLAIARTLVAGPDVYLFDDAFSALDQRTEAALRAALAVETADATVVMVAQRVSSVRDADRIVVLDDGRVAGTGSHEELCESSPTYRAIVRSQSPDGVVA